MMWKMSRLPKVGIKLSKARDWMCKNFFDIRNFWSCYVAERKTTVARFVDLSRLIFARSIDPVLPLEITITRNGRCYRERSQEPGR